MFVMWNGTDTVNNTGMLCAMERTQWITQVCYVQWNRHSEWHMFVMCISVQRTWQVNVNKLNGISAVSLKKY